MSDCEYGTSLGAAPAAATNDVITSSEKGRAKAKEAKCKDEIPQADCSNRQFGTRVESR